MRINSTKTSSGYTLIEILVVIVIMAIVTTIATLAFSHFNRGRHVLIAAQQLAQTMRVAQQEAILRPAVLGMRLTTQGYQFYTFAVNEKSPQGTWEALTHDKLSRPDAFQHSIVVKRVKLNQKNAADKTYIVFSASGDVSPTRLIVRDKHTSRTYEINVQNNGAVQMKELLKHNEK